MVSISSVKSSSTQQDVHLVNYGPIYFKIDKKTADVLGRVIYHGELLRFFQCLVDAYSTKNTPMSQLPVSTLCFKPVFY